jgi:hypothetical protein
MRNTLSLAGEVEANKTSEAENELDDVDVETKVKDYRDV